MKLLHLFIFALLVAQSVQAVVCPCGRPGEMPVHVSVQIPESHQRPDRSLCDMSLTAQLKRTRIAKEVKAFCNNHAGKLVTTAIVAGAALTVYNSEAIAAKLSESYNQLATTSAGKVVSEKASAFANLVSEKSSYLLARLKAFVK